MCLAYDNHFSRWKVGDNLVPIQMKELVQLL